MAIMEYDKQKKVPESESLGLYWKLCGNNGHLTKDRIEDEDLPVLLNYLSHSSCISMLDLRFNKLEDGSAKAIATFLRGDKLLQELNLQGNEITDAGVKFIAESLVSNDTLMILKMGGNPIGAIGSLHLAHALQLNRTLEYLDIGETSSNVDGWIALCTVLKNNHAVLGLNLSRPLLYTAQEEHVVHVQDMLAINKTLKALHLSKAHITDFGACRLSEALLRNSSLELLDISA
ncbi:Leucine-rich repeat-containing protein 34 [Cichlidogyrus casuarinus]|uniref:Leucine-rich repeat-containing protein 34 n=1 Tax=Cichlidogyrus casuarinus TaxID=1844966 RepID=A0ABD2PLG3_9PLAT